MLPAAIIQSHVERMLGRRLSEGERAALESVVNRFCGDTLKRIAELEDYARVQLEVAAEEVRLRCRVEEQRDRAVGLLRLLSSDMRKMGWNGGMLDPVDAFLATLDAPAPTKPEAPPDSRVEEDGG